MGKSPTRVVAIALDGICVEGLKKANTPNIDKLMAEGVVSWQTRNVMPSVTLPNWTSHLTGSGPEQHGVTDNKWTKEKHILPPIDKDNDGYYPSVFEVLKTKIKDIKIAFYYNWTPLVYPYNKKYIDELVFLEEEEYIPYYNEAFDFIVKNKKYPTFVFLYTVHTDTAGHKYGWMSDKYINSIEEADIHIGELIDKMKEKDLYEDTHFLFLTDHGGIKKSHGGVTPNEMIVPWSINGPKIKKKGWK